jgi:hypothetical protein
VRSGYIDKSRGIRLRELDKYALYGIMLEEIRDLGLMGDFGRDGKV